MRQDIDAVLGPGWRLDAAALGSMTATLRRAVPARAHDGRLWLLADRDPEPGLLPLLESQLRCRLRWLRREPGEVSAWLEQAEAQFRALDRLGDGESASAAPSDVPRELSVSQLTEQASPAVRLVDAVVYDALKDGASDIHLETDARGAGLRVRIDGVVLPMRRVDGVALAEQFVSRLKVLAELDIGERRLPQDGRFRMRVGGRDVDFRLSIMPTVHGEDAVVRVLDRNAVELGGQLTLASLGFAPEPAAQLLEQARQPHGMLLVAGPTGSGKTTTLYAAITQTLSGSEKVVTIEDPVEYRLPGVVQIPVNDRKGLSFARGLRSVLRHDPDRIMVGEIRDEETAQIAVQAALTGHLVFTTVHANNALDVVARFMHMGLDLHNVASALNLVVAQRLMRRICASCAPEPESRGFGPRLAGPGCARCRGTGYHGRHAIAELMRLDDELRDMIAARAPMSRIKQAVRDRGMVPLREAAALAVREGWTTEEECNRVTLAS